MDDAAALREIEAIKQLKARYCRFLDTKDLASWRAVFTADLVVTLARSEGGAGGGNANPGGANRGGGAPRGRSRGR